MQYFSIKYEAENALAVIHILPSPGGLFGKKCTKFQATTLCFGRLGKIKVILKLQLDVMRLETFKFLFFNYLS